MAGIRVGVMNSPPKTPLLDTVDLPSDLRQLKKDQLRQLSDELRSEMIDAVRKILDFFLPINDDII